MLAAIAIRINSNDRWNLTLHKRCSDPPHRKKDGITSSTRIQSSALSVTRSLMPSKTQTIFYVVDMVLCGGRCLRQKNVSARLLR